MPSGSSGRSIHPKNTSKWPAFFDRVKLIIHKEFHHFLYGGFLKWWYPKMDGLLRENPIKMDDLGVPDHYFGKHPYVGNNEFQNKACPPKMAKKPSRALVLSLPAIVFFQTVQSTGGFLGRHRVFRCPPVLVGRHRGCHCGPNNVSTPGALGVGPEGGGFFMKEDFFCWRFTSEFFFGVRKWRAIFQVPWFLRTLRILTPPMETPDPPSDTPGASKNMLLTPLDIPRILREGEQFWPGPV